MTHPHKKCFCDVHDSCGLHADKPPKERFDEKVEEQFNSEKQQRLQQRDV